jgi:predicted Fe-Mo cluster-binding NifX family protein
VILAVPVFGGEISPRFDCARETMIIRLEDGKIAGQSLVATKETSPLHRARILSALQVELVICSGIDDFCVRMLNGMGIQVLPWISGNLQEVLDNFLAARESANHLKR